MNISKKQVLVTGAGGFIGSHLVNHLLERGCSVRAFIHYDCRSDYGNLDFIDREKLREVEIVSGDIQDPFSVRQAVDSCEIVFHLAALIGIPYSHVAPASYVSTNIMGTLNVLEASRRSSVQRLIHTSTSECYGTALYTPIDEQHPLQGQSPYSASKIGADKLVESYYNSFDLPASILRPFNTFGPRQNSRAIIPSIISQLLWGNEELTLGSLEPKRDFLFVRDTCEAFCRIAETDETIGETIHVGTGKMVTIGELANLLIEITGTRKSIRQDEQRIRPEKSEVMALICNPAKAKELMNWNPNHVIEEGLELVVQFIADHKDKYFSTAYRM